MQIFSGSGAPRWASETGRIGLLLLLAVVGGCPESPPPPPWDPSAAGVVGPETEQEGGVHVDVYLDGTTSMEGYATQGSAYGQFLDALASSITAGWPQADVRYYRFGSRVEPIEEAAFLSARTDLAFYRQPGLFETTNIDSVLARADPDRVGVVVTDLFQSDGNTNALVRHIKDGPFRQELDVAVLGIPSAFSGQVYDAPGGTYPYASTAGDASTYRPFYALLFGRPANIARLFETLRSRPFVGDGRFLLISPYVVDGYSVALEKTRASQEITPPARRGENQFAFNVQAGGSGGTLTADVALAADPLAPPVTPDRVELVAFRRAQRGGAWSADSVRVRDFTLRASRWSGDTLHATLDFRLDEPAGTYSYLLVLQAGSVGGLRAPGWVRALSSDAPSATSDANRTLNLAPLVEGLLQARTTLRQPRLAQFIVTVRKS